MKTWCLNYLICGRSDASMGLSEQVESERNRAQSMLITIVKDERGVGESTGNLKCRTSQAVHTNSFVHARYTAEWGKKTRQEITSLSRWFQDLLALVMMANTEQKHFAVGARLECLGCLSQRSSLCDCGGFWIEVKIPQKYNSQAVWKIHPSEPESG